MIRFNNDYNRGCIPAILAALEATNDETFPGYGTDSLCDGAVKLLRNEIGWPDADIHFLPGATQANFSPRRCAAPDRKRHCRADRSHRRPRSRLCRKHRPSDPQRAMRA